MGRKVVIAGNWKMFKTQSQAVELVKALQTEVGGYDKGRRQRATKSMYSLSLSK